MSVEIKKETRDEFTIETRQYDFYKHPTILVYSGETMITSASCKTEKAITKLVEKARGIVARKNLKKAAAFARRAEKDAAKGTIRDECQICAGSWAMVDGMTSLHGYTRPGHGWLEGQCMGAKQLPFSKSCAVLRQYRESVVNYHHRVSLSVATHKAGKITAIICSESVPGSFGRKQHDVIYRKGEPMPEGSQYVNSTFDRVLAMKIASLESEVRHAGFEITRVDARIALWQSKYGN